ncbi:MAG: hypothetical protein IKM36_06320 [Oscillospiraceae bacterium]|nr:hypothetical protein [Oscillospiraceae bacterium]MBR3850085.1 hypothetical protein [Oscillospiraceae bacterium]
MDLLIILGLLIAISLPFAVIYVSNRYITPWWENLKARHQYDDPKPWWWYIFVGP